MTRNSDWYKSVANPYDALRLVLLFHRGGQWTAADINRWKRITGNADATSKALCDHIRRVLATEPARHSEHTDPPHTPASE